MTAVLIPADIRFPLERANGVQIVKTAAALSRAGAATTLLVRDSDPRPTDEILALFGIAPGGLQRAAHRRRAPRAGLPPPRAAFLARAGAACLAALQRGASSSRATCSSPICCSPLRRRARVVYEAHAVESILYRERGALYGTADPPGPPRPTACAAGRRGCGGGRAAFVATTAGIRDTFSRAVRGAARGRASCRTGATCPRTARSPAWPRSGRRASSTPASSIRGRAWTCWWRRWPRCPTRAW